MGEWLKIWWTFCYSIHLNSTGPNSYICWSLSLHNARIMLHVCFLLTIFTLSVVQAISPSILGKVDALHNPSYRFHRSSQYIRTLLKYKITPTHPDALPVHELISKDGRILRNDVNLGLVPASFHPSGRILSKSSNHRRGLRFKDIHFRLRHRQCGSLGIFDALTFRPKRKSYSLRPHRIQTPRCHWERHGISRI